MLNLAFRPKTSKNPCNYWIAFLSMPPQACEATINHSTGEDFTLAEYKNLKRILIKERKQGIKHHGLDDEITSFTIQVANHCIKRLTRRVKRRAAQ